MLLLLHENFGKQERTFKVFSIPVNFRPNLQERSSIHHTHQILPTLLQKELLIEIYSAVSHNIEHGTKKNSYLHVTLKQSYCNCMYVEDTDPTI